MTAPSGEAGPRPDPAGVGPEWELPILGEPAPIELVNTAHTWDGVVEESLPSPGALRAWCTEVLGTGDDLVVDEGDLASVHRLRRTVAGVVAALCGGPAPGDDALAVLDRHLGAATAHHHLVVRDGRVVVTSTDPPRSVAEALGRLAAATVELVATVPEGRLRGCANPPCGMVFLARHGRRRFCHSWCSDHDRQRRFRLRHGGDAGGGGRAAAPG